MMKTLKFLCVILSCSSCVTGLDLNASKYVGWDFSSFHHFNNIIKINQNKFPWGQFPHSFPITILISSLAALSMKICPCCVELIWDLLVQMSIRTTKLSFATYTGGLQTDLVTVHFLLRILTQCCARTSSTHLLAWIMSHIQFRVKTVNLIQKKMVSKLF